MKTNRGFARAGDELWSIGLTGAARVAPMELNLQQIIEFLIAKDFVWGLVSGYEMSDERYLELAGKARNFAAKPTYPGQTFRYDLDHQHGMPYSLIVDLSAVAITVKMIQDSITGLSNDAPPRALSPYSWPVREIVVQFHTLDKVCRCEFSYEYRFGTSRQDRLWSVRLKGTRVFLVAMRSRRWLQSLPNELMEVLMSEINSFRRYATE